LSISHPDVIVIGAGAAGIIAAWRAASLGARVTLFEKNDRIGLKILISGGGKCNITHDGTVEDVLSGFRTNEARFLRPSLYKFTNRDVLDLLDARGLEVYTRPDGRVFPTHGNAKDVVAILDGYLQDAGVRVKLKAPVTGLESRNGRVCGVRLGNELVSSSHFILSVGGSSYPGAGTTGDGYPWAGEVGHTIVKVRAALAPVFTQPVPPPEWAGVALRDCMLKARQNGKEIARWRGDLLFTHRGVSGPTVLAISRDIAERRDRGPIALTADLVPDQTYEQLNEGILKVTRVHPRRSIAVFLDSVLPNRLVGPLLDAAHVERDTIGAQLTLKARNRLVEAMKAWNFGDVHHVPLEKGEVVAGGVSLGEVDPHTMRSQCAAGLYLCGEILDVAGAVGGYNLQAAFSTGYVAGETAATDAAEYRIRSETG
jgi:predicted Rossmann fold flavoprotein